MARLIEEDEVGLDSRLSDFLESMLRHKAEMVTYEAANAIVTLKRSSARDLPPAISVLQLFLSSPKPTLRWVGIGVLGGYTYNHLPKHWGKAEVEEEGRETN